MGAIFNQGVDTTTETDADKHGPRRSAAAEIWKQDYNGEPYVSHNGTLYGVDACTQTGRGTVTLKLTEVWR